MEAWFLSDIHLKSQEERNGQILLRFLRSLLEKDPRETRLYLLGDIFDLWIGKHQFFADRFQPLMDCLKQLTSKGMEVYYIEGNHDVHIEGFFQKKLGIRVHVDPQYHALDGQVVRIEHGDLINLNDAAYLKYRAIIRHPWIKPLGNLLPGSFWAYIGNRASKKSRTQSAHYRSNNEEKLMEMIRFHAHRAYREKAFDLIVTGHMHIFDDYSFVEDGKNVRSINLGSWFEESVRVLRWHQGQVEWVTIS